MTTPAFIMHAGRIFEVVAQARVNNVPSVVVRDGQAVMTIPLAIAVAAEAPRVRLVVDNTRRE